jgi:hypothetical protein
MSKPKAPAKKEQPRTIPAAFQRTLDARALRHQLKGKSAAERNAIRNGK